MAEWILIFTLKIFHGKNEIYHGDSFKSFERCVRQGKKDIKPYRGAMSFKCERRSR